MSDHFRRIGIAANEAAPADPILFEQALHSNFIGSMLVLPSDGKTLVTASEDGQMWRVNLETFETAQLAAEHTSAVNSIACSEDGTRLVSASDDLTLRVWDTSTWQSLMTLEGHTAYVSRVAVVRGKIVSGSKDGSVRVWDLATGAHLHTFGGHTQWILAMTAVPGKPEVITASMDGTMKHWNVDLGDEIRVLDDRSAKAKPMEIKGTGLVHIPENRTGIGHTTYAHDMVVTADGSWVVSADKEILLTELATGSQRANRTGHPWGIKAVRLSRDGRRIFVAGDGVRVVGFDDGREIAALMGGSDEITSMAIDPNERWLVTGSKGGRVRVRDLARAMACGPARQHSKRVIAAAVSPDARIGVSGGQDGNAGIWDLQTGALRGLCGHASAFVGSVAFTPDGSRVVTATQDGEVRVWDAVTAEAIDLPKMFRKGYWINALAVMPDGHSAIAGAIGSGLTRWNLVDGGAPKDFEGKTQHVLTIALARNATRAVTCGYVDKKPGILQCWDLEKDALLWTVQPDDGYPNCLAILEGERVIATGGSKGAVTLWSLDDGKILRTWDGHAKFVSQIFALPGGRIATTALMTPEGARRSPPSPYVIRTWNVETGERVSELTVPDVRHARLAIVDGGRRAIARVNDEVRLLNLESGAFEAAVEGLGVVATVAVSADERTVLAGCDDGRLHVLSRAAPG